MSTTCASPFEVVSFQDSLISEGSLPRPPWGNSSTSQNPPLSTGNLARQMSLVGLDSCTRERIRQQQQMQQQQQQQQECSQGGASENLQSQLSQQLSQHNPSTKVPAFALRAAPRRLELSQNLSQEFLSTPDLSTPQDQQFHVAYDPCASMSGMVGEDGASRSPAPSPHRLQKRPRALAEQESESMSQPSQSQSRSQGEPSTCSKASGLRSGKPPMHPGGRSGNSASNRLLRHGPPVIRNPYLTPGNDDTHLFHPPNGRSCSRADVLPPKQNRLTWDYKQENVLGNGNFSTVYRVTHRMSGKQYAIKKSRKSAVSVADKNMWLAEVQALAAVEGHPNIVTYYDSWTEPAEQNQGEHFFIKLELCGDNLCKPSPQQQQQQSSAANASSSATIEPSPSLPTPIAIEPAGSTSSGTCLTTGSSHRNHHGLQLTQNGNTQQQPQQQQQQIAAAAGGRSGSSGASGARVAMKEAELLEVLRQMASALQHIHALGLAHLDLKPDNIYRARPPPDSAASNSWTGFKVPRGAHKDPQSSVAASASTPFGSASLSSSPPHQPETYKLGDFGLATAKDGSGRVVEGDARYLAPELLNGRYAEVGLDKADMFALGATLYELATGTGLPASGERFHAIRQGQLMMMPHVSVKLQSLIKRLMSHDPRSRPTAEQVLKNPLLHPQQQQAGAAALQNSGSFAMAISP
mmetsp:Transcript_6241/g.16568  ORF Transcript_6241/g.16568 Transcript_6241/m.16568 type:complete len:692 (+) Transcript_6241:253-2328(+)